MRLRPDELAVLVLDLTNFARLCARLPAVGGDEVAIVLHGLGPVVHEVLVDVVGIEQRRWPEGGEQVLGDGFDQRLGVAVLGEAGESWRAWPAANWRTAWSRLRWNAANSAWPKMVGFTSASGSFSCAVAGAVGRTRTARRARWG